MSILWDETTSVLEGLIRDVIATMEQARLPLTLLPFELVNDFTIPFTVHADAVNEELERNAADRRRGKHAEPPRSHFTDSPGDWQKWEYKGPTDTREAAGALGRIQCIRRCLYKGGCGICFEETMNTMVKVTPCGHLFHSGCLTPWTDMKQKRTCPSCRGELFPHRPPDEEGEDEDPTEPLSPLSWDPASPSSGGNARLYWTPEQLLLIHDTETRIEDLQIVYDSLYQSRQVAIRSQTELIDRRPADGAIRLNHDYSLPVALDVPEVIIDDANSNGHYIVGIRVDSTHYDTSTWSTISVDPAVDVVREDPDSLRHAYLIAARTVLRIEIARQTNILDTLRAQSRLIDLDGDVEQDSLDSGSESDPEEGPRSPFRDRPLSSS